MERDPLVRGLLLLLVAICLIWLAGWAWGVVSQISDILLLFFLAWLLAFVLDPVAAWLQRLGLPRLAAVGTVYLALLVVAAISAVAVMPTAATQAVQLGTGLPALVNELQLRAGQAQDRLLQLGLSESQLNDFYLDLSTRAQAVGTALLSNGLAVATAILSTMFNLTIVIIMSFYIMLDGQRLSRLFVTALPVRYRRPAAAALGQVDRTFGGFVRGQLIQMAIYGLGTALVMVAAGLPYYVVLGILAGVAMIIPVIGPYLAMGPPLILAVIVAPSTVWWVFILLFVLQFVVVNIMMPRVMGQNLGLHPLEVFAAVLVGARIGGAWGAIFAAPVVAILHILGGAFYQRVVMRMPLYREGTPLSPQALVPPPVVGPSRLGPEPAPAAEKNGRGPEPASVGEPSRRRPAPDHEEVTEGTRQSA